MSIALSDDAKRASSPAATLRSSEILGWLTLAVFLAVSLPLFLRMPVWVDVAFYDLCARHVLHGGALERDFLFLQPPGMPWALAGVRSFLGWSSEAVRLADLAIVSAIIWLLTRWLAATGLSRAARVWVAVLLYSFYLTTSEWVHCQPDTWMLLPALAALHLRRKLVTAWAGQSGAVTRSSMWSLLEGVLWAAGCLFKPFLALPALLTWLVSIGLVGRSGRGWGWWLVSDGCCLLAGGLLVGAAWQGWLLASGSWAPYWHNVYSFRDYSPPVYTFSLRCLGLLATMWPWGLLHLAALPVAVTSLARVLLPLRQANGLSAATGDCSNPLLAAFYGGFLYQAYFVQHQGYYHLAPVLLLAVTLSAGGLATAGRLRLGWTAVVVLTACGVAWQSAFLPERLSLWGRCWVEGDSPELRDRLAVGNAPPVPPEGRPDWQALEKVEDFLRRSQVSDGELTCYNVSALHLYLRLGIKPSTRFLMPDTLIRFCPQKREEILQELKTGTGRYLVTDMRGPEARLSQAQALAERSGQPLAFPPDFPSEPTGLFPFTEPVVFRAGRYYVHRVQGQQPSQEPAPPR